MINAKVIKSFNQTTSNVPANTLTTLVTVNLGTFNTAVIYLESANYSNPRGYSRANLGLFIIPNMDYDSFAAYANSSTGEYLTSQNYFRIKTTSDSVIFNYYYSGGTSSPSIAGLIAVLS